MHLQCADSGNDGDHVGFQAGLAALDVEEFLRTEVGAETGFCNDIIGQLEAGSGGHHGVAAVGNIGERAAMDDGGGTFQGLHQVRHHGVLEQGGHGAVGLDVLAGDGLHVAGIADDDIRQPLAQVFEVGSQAEDCHDFGSHGDVETGLAREAVARAAQGDGDVAQGAVIHVDDAAPGDAAHVDTQGIGVVNVVVQHGGQQVVGRTDGMEVAGEVQIDILHRNDLGITATSCTTFHAETGSQAGLAQADRGFLANAAQGIAKADRGGGLAFACRSRGNRGHQDKLPVFAFALGAQEVVIDLGLVRTVLEQGFRGDAQFFADFADQLRLGFLGNLDI